MYLASHLCPSSRLATYLCTTARLVLQDEKLPLHHAAANGAPLEVMKLLLDANPEAVNVADKVRR